MINHKFISVYEVYDLAYIHLYIEIITQQREDMRFVFVWLRPTSFPGIFPSNL